MSAWAGVGAAYAASYADLCIGTAPAIRTAVGPARDRALLDVGSGTGALGALLASAGWQVTGCEPEQSMRAVSAAQHPTVRVVDGALPSLPFPDAAFDAVTANFVLNHVSEPRASAAELVRVAAPGATLVATIWTLAPAWFWAEVCEGAGLAGSTGDRLPAEQDFERTANGFALMLADGGWHAEVDEITWTWHAPREALWESAAGGVASAGSFYLSLDAGERVLFRDAFDALCDVRAEAGRIALQHTAALAVARR